MCCLLLDGMNCCAYNQLEGKFNKESNTTIIESVAYKC